MRASGDNLEDAYKFLRDDLKKRNFNVLHFVCCNLGCLPSATGHRLTKNDLVGGLVKWRHEKPLVSANAPPPRIVTPLVISRIWDVLRDLVKPS